MSPFFWTIIAIMTGIALLFVIFPLLRKSSPAIQVQRNALNIAIYKERLAELEQAVLSPEEFVQAKQALQKNLAQALTPSVTDPEQNTSHQVNIYTSLAMFVVIPTLAIGGYFYLKTPTDWQVLAYTYVATEQYEEAIQIYEYLLASTEAQDPGLLTNFAEVLAMARQGQWQGRPSTLLETALSLNSNAEKTLWLAGVSAVQQGDYPRAIQHWQQLIEQTPPTALEKRQLLQKQVTRLQQWLQGKSVEPATQNAIHLELQVKLHATFQHLVKPTDTVFIYARASTGSTLPLIAMKKTVADLPLTVTLARDDLVTDVETVTLVARVAKSGQVIAQSGDLQGQVTDIPMQALNPVEILINTVIP